MEKISDNQILEILKKYEEKANADYAIMIDGEWGCGKTHFIKNKFVADNKNRIYISLYGLKTTAEIDKKIYYQILEKSIPKKLNLEPLKKLKTVGNTVFSLTKEAIKETFKIDIENIKDISATDILSLFNDISKYVIVFDDLERCEISIVQLFGYINQYVEHKNTKIIIIANEKEILKSKMYSNNELKYLVAENPSLNIPVTKRKIDEILESKEGSGENNAEKLDIKDLNERVEKIFGEDLLYAQTKEKLIGFTIYYLPNIEETTEEIINQTINNKKVKKYLLEFKDLVVDAMINKNHINVRTLKIALQILNDVLSAVFKADFSMYNSTVVEECKNEIVKYTINACIEYKCGKSIQEGKGKFFKINDENSFVNGKNGFKFINDIITKSYVDDNEILKVVKDYIEFKSKDTTSTKDPINVLAYYWEMSDAEIENEYKKLKEKLKDKSYANSEYIKVIYIIFKLVKVGFPKEYLEETKDCMIHNLENEEKVEDFNNAYEYDFSFSTKEEREEFYKIIEPLKEYIKKLKQENIVADINSIINKEDGWGEEFVEYCNKNRNNFYTKQKLFCLLDVENLIECIKVSKTKDISDFRRIMMTLYDFSNIRDYFISDINNLELFLKKIQVLINSKEYQSFDNTKKYNIEWIERNTTIIIERLKKQNN